MTPAVPRMLTKAHRQRLEAAQGGGAAPLHFLGPDRQPQVWKSLQQHAECYPCLQSCERRPQAEMDAQPEGDVPVWPARDVQAVGVRKHPVVAVGRGYTQHNGTAPPYGLAVQLDIFQ